MKKLILSTVISASLFSAFAADLKTSDDKISYAVGNQMGMSISENVKTVIKLNKKVLIDALNDAIDGKESKMTPQEINKVMLDFQQKSMKFAQKEAEKAQKKAEKAKKTNEDEGKKFLEKNKKEKGVKITESGIQYKVITEGKGKKPKATDTVEVHYVGTLIDGTEFDSSVKRGKPVKFPLNAVIPGWTEALQLMTVGSKYEIVIPARLAYGDQAPANIGPSRTLKFEVELLSIVKAEKKQAPAVTQTPTPKKEGKAKVPTTKEASTDMVEEGKEVVKETTDSVMDKAKDAVKDTADKAVDTAKDAVKETVEKAADKAMDKVKDMAK